MFITIEDETGPAKIVVWPTLFEKRRRVVLGSSTMAINGRIQQEAEVAQQLFDLSGDLSGLADCDTEFRLPTGRGHEFAHWVGPDPRDTPKPVVQARDMFARFAYRHAEGEGPEFVSVQERKSLALSPFYCPLMCEGGSSNHETRSHNFSSSGISEF